MPTAREPQQHSIPEAPATVDLARTTLAEESVAVEQSALPSASGQRWWLSLLILALLVGVGYPLVKQLLLAPRVERKTAPVRVVPVVTAPVERADMNVYLNGLGTVTGYKTVTIRSRVEGELIKVAFSEGQMVKQGDLLAEIDPRPFQVQLDQAKARLGEAQAALQKAEHSQAREMAQAQLVLDESQLLLAQKEEQRLSKLVPNRTVTADQWDAAIANRQKCEAQVQSTKANLKQAEADYGVNILSAQANLSAANTAVRNAEIELSYCRITSPIAGRIGLRYVDLGNMIRPTDEKGLAVITQLQPIAVIFTVPQDEIAPIQTKMLAGEKLRVDAFDRNFRAELARGELEAIDNQVDVTTGTIRLKAVFANDKNGLFPNQFVNARLLVDTLRQVVTVPSAAVQRGPESAYAYVVQADSTVVLRSIVAGPTEGDTTSIESGLSPGEIVVIDGVDKLHQGAKVAARGENSPAAASEPVRQTQHPSDREKKGT
ncbi:MAG: efflux RND transporter periplasmic adaptor subunit [Pirellulales bacterium]|nr:efflux RND transporter periplasmic adaptor subunit [Pirellulales bacterium]